MPAVIKDLTTGVIRTDFDVDDEEYHAIGRMTVHWAYLEHGVFAVTFDVCHRANAPLPDDARSTSFKRRLRAMRLAIEEFESEPEKKRLLRLADQIANAEQDRHKITHAMWDWDLSNPNVISASSFRPGFEFEKAFNAKKINKLADKIGEITCALEYPGGLSQVLEERFGDGDNAPSFGISRKLARALTDPEYRDRLLTGLAKHKGD